MSFSPVREREREGKYITCKSFGKEQLMAAINKSPTTAAGAAATNHPPLNYSKLMRRAAPNRAFGLIYAFAIVALFYHHAQTLLCSTATFSATITTLLLLLADAVFAFMWITTEAFRVNPVYREEYPENLVAVMPRERFPEMDVFICTADPYKEPPMGVVNTALSVMAYEYPLEKTSVYVSDDGGSELTLFAFMEAAKFAGHWLPFCRENNLVERSPEAYFASSDSHIIEAEKIKMMYESMKMRVEHVVKRGKVDEEYIHGNREHEALSRWTEMLTHQDHPTIIQVLLDNSKDKDITGNLMPNLIYLSREKRMGVPHNFKAGALNALLRVSAVMSNAPIILTLDCDMSSNDPGTPIRVLCYLADPSLDQSPLGYVQFPQRFQEINENDIYGVENKRAYQINPIGMKDGPDYFGTGCFFRRRCLFGGPSSFVLPEIPELSPDHCTQDSVCSEEILALAHKVVGCKYEHQTDWGYKIGFRYGSLVEDYYTGYKLHCEGWKSVFCHPERAAFLGDAPICLNDVLSQSRRWTIGLLEVVFSKYCPLTFGVRSIGLLMGLCYAHYVLWPIWSIPITIYAFLPQIALINSVSIFPKVSDPWFALYIFLFFGAYIQDLVDYILAGHGGTLARWWSDQRMWLIRGPTSHLFGTIEYALKSLGISAHGFNVTSKVVDEEQSKRYEQGLFEFGDVTPMFVSLAVVAIVNFVSFAHGVVEVVKGSGHAQGLVLQILLAGFGVMNCWPIYEAMLLRNDKGRLPTKVTLISAFVASLICAFVSFA